MILCEGDLLKGLTCTADILFFLRTGHYWGGCDDEQLGGILLPDRQ